MNWSFSPSLKEPDWHATYIQASPCKIKPWWYSKGHMWCCQRTWGCLISSVLSDPECCSQVSLHFVPYIPEHNVIACHVIFDTIPQRKTFYLMPFHRVPFLPSRPTSQTTCQQQVIKCNEACRLHLITLCRGEFQNMSTQVEGWNGPWQHVVGL